LSWLKECGALSSGSAKSDIRQITLRRDTRAPTFMRLTVPAQPRIEGAGLDFRDEIMAQIYDRGDVRPKRVLTFNIQVTDDGETHGPPFRERRTFRNWHRIGTITFDRAVVSYNGDSVIHFHHPTWRDDQN